MPLRAFVSHAGADDDFSARLVRDLRGALGGDEAVYDGAAASDAEPLDSAARRAIEDREIFIVVLSPDAMASARVNAAIDLAWTLRQSPTGKRVIPVLSRPCTVRDDLDTIQRVSFAPPRDYAAALAELLGILRSGDTRAADVPLGGTDAEIAVPDRRPRRLRRSSLVTAVVSVLLLVAVAAAALRLVPALGRSLVHGAPRATGTPIAGTATPTPHAWPTPLTTTPYSVLVPGTCPGNTGWTYADEANVHSYTCQSDGLELSATPQAAHDTYLGAGEMGYDASPVAAHAYDLSFQVRGLSANAVVTVTMGYQTADYSSNDLYILYLGDRKWDVFRTGTGHATYTLGDGNLETISDFRFDLTFHPGTITLVVGSALNTTLPDPIPPPVEPVGSVAFDVGPGFEGGASSAVFSQFRFAPLTQ